jgi:general L-amino acid transport system substrate-binding protein
MRQAYVAAFMMLLTTVALSGCLGGDDEITQADVDAARAEGNTAGYTTGETAGYTAGFAAGSGDANATVITPADVTAAGTANYTAGFTAGEAAATSVSTLDTVIAAGTMKCGVKTSQFAMGYLDEDGVRSGLDIEYCRALAAAIGLNPDTDIEYVLATGSNRFALLASGDIDVLIRTTTWTTSRDADLNADFAGINFFDGQGMLVNLDAHPGATSIMQLDGATVCVGIGTTTEGNLADYFTVNSLAYTAVNSADADTAKASFINEECTAWTGDMSAMVAQKYGLEQGSGQSFAMGIMSELMSKEPLAAATRDNDDDWNDVVTWVWYGMLTAEELGINSGNYAAADLSDPSLNRLLNSTLGLGTEANPLSATWMQSVLATSGNYYEAYDRSFCDGAGTMSNCLIDRAGTYNAPHWEGGLQYAPPMR